MGEAHTVYPCEGFRGEVRNITFHQTKSIATNTHAKVQSVRNNSSETWGIFTS